MNVNIVWISLFVLLFETKDSKGESIYREECDVWKDVTNRVEREPRLNVTCEVNKDCIGFDCNGDYTYNGVITGNKDVVRHVCFGVYLHPCHDPQDMTVYIEVWEKSKYNVSYMRDINGDKTETIHGVKENVEVEGFPMAELTVELTTEFDVVGRNRKKYAKIEMILQPQIHPVFGPTQTPRSARVVMVPEMEVPVPPCRKSVKEIKHTPYVCPDLKEGSYIPPAAESFLPGTPCTIHTLGECEHMQKCKQNVTSSTDGVCICVVGYAYNGDTGKCEALTPTALPILDDGLAPESGSHNNKKHVWVIVGSVTAVFVVAILVVLVIFKYRHHKRRFRANEDQEQIMAQAEDIDPIAL